LLEFSAQPVTLTLLWEKGQKVYYSKNCKIHTHLEFWDEDSKMWWTKWCFVELKCIISWNCKTKKKHSWDWQRWNITNQRDICICVFPRWL